MYHRHTVSGRTIQESTVNADTSGGVLELVVEKQHFYISTCTNESNKEQILELAHELRYMYMYVDVMAMSPMLTIFYSNNLWH